MEKQIMTAKTPLFFQKALVEEIKRITKDMLFQNPEGEELLKLEVFAQSLPIPERKQMADNDDTYKTIDYVDVEPESAVCKCPWCIVKIENGNIAEINGFQNVEVVIGFGIYNPDNENNGHEELLNLIQKIYKRFSCDPLLDQQYTCTGAFEWALQEEDTFPYFFGAIGTTFQFTGYRREFKF